MNCTYFESVGFDVEKNLLRRISAGSASDEKGFWHYTLIPKKGQEVTMSMSAAEISALLEKVYEYCEKKNYPCK